MDRLEKTASIALLRYIRANARLFSGQRMDGTYPQGWGRVRCDILVHWKNEWIRLMRLSDPGEHADGGKELWENAMRAARQEIDRREDANPPRAARHAPDPRPDPRPPAPPPKPRAAALLDASWGV